MTKLTLPIEIGKKYVRRDGSAVEAGPSKHGREWVRIDYSESLESDRHSVRVNHGKVWSDPYRELPFDLVSDYIDPAKGHPHAEKMAEFAQDARETDKPWERWEWAGSNSVWHPVERCAPTWEAHLQYRRKPTITPDPHAASMLLYAQDAAETDRAWERWEWKRSEGHLWRPLESHPAWEAWMDFRKAQS